MANNIYLVGMMGSGKSVVSKLLGKKLNREVVDLDDAIVEKEGSSIADIFETKGEPTFREIEKAILEENASKDKAIVATGGGIVTNDVNLNLMKETGVVVYLKAPSDVLYSRIKNDGSRPLLKGGDPEARLSDIFESRKPQYEKADYIISVSDKKPDQVAEDLQELLELEGKI